MYVSMHTHVHTYLLRISPETGEPSDVQLYIQPHLHMRKQANGKKTSTDKQTARQADAQEDADAQTHRGFRV